MRCQYSYVKPLSISSTAGVASQYPDFDSDQQTEFTSPVYPEKEGEVSDRESDTPGADSDQ